jgi:predicted  nucleic acid-binding Zn-ribbon protein
MKPSLIPQLKKLVTIDSSIRKVMSEIEKASALIQEDVAALSGMQKRIETLLAEKKAAQQMVDSQELESKILREKEQKIRNDLEQIRSTKEYTSKEKELAHVSNERLLLDDVIIKVWHDLENAEKKIALEKPEYQSKHDALLEEKNKKEAELKLLTDQLAQYENDRQEASVHVPAEWLTKYSRMRLRVDDPIVSLSETHCSACYYTVPRQELANLKRDSLIICRNCYRFIYLPSQNSAESNT